MMEKSAFLFSFYCALLLTVYLGYQMTWESPFFFYSAVFRHFMRGLNREECSPSSVLQLSKFSLLSEPIEAFCCTNFYLDSTNESLSLCHDFTQLFPAVITSLSHWRQLGFVGTCGCDIFEGFS